MSKKIKVLPRIKNTFNVSKSKFGHSPVRNEDGSIHTGWYSAQEMNSHYYLDSSREHANWINNFNSSNYNSVHILGNSPCLNKIPNEVLDDKSSFVIGLNRSFIKSASDVLIWRDVCTIEDMADKFNTEPYKTRLTNTRLIKAGMDIPQKKAVMRKDAKTGEGFKSIELKEHTNISKINGKFYPEMSKYCNDIKLGNPIDNIIDLDDIEQFQFNEDYISRQSRPMVMLLSVAHAAMHLVTQLFKDNKVPVYLHGISYDYRTYFYWEDESLNKGIKSNTRAKQFKVTQEEYGMGREVDFEVLKKNIDEIKPDGTRMEHREVCYYMLRYLFMHGYKVYYSAESKLLDWMATRFDELEKVSYG